MTCAAGELLDVAEELLLGRRRRFAEELLEAVEEHVGAPGGTRCERLRLELPAQVLRPRPHAAAQGEQRVEQVARGVGGIQVRSDHLAETVSLERPIGAVDVGVECRSGDRRRGILGQRSLAVDDLADLAVELVDEHLGMAERVSVPPMRRPGLAVRSQAGDGVGADLDRIPVLGVVTLLVVGECADANDQPDVPVGVVPHEHAGRPRPVEDQPQDRLVGPGRLEELLEARLRRHPGRVWQCGQNVVVRPPTTMRVSGRPQRSHGSPPRP